MASSLTTDNRLCYTQQVYQTQRQWRKHLTWVSGAFGGKATHATCISTILGEKRNEHSKIKAC